MRQSLVNFVHQKVGQLADLSNSLQEARVTLKLDKAEPKDSKTCEILGVLRGNDGFAEKKADSFDQAVIKAVEALKDSLQTEKTSSSNRPVNPPYGGTG